MFYAITIGILIIAIVIGLGLTLRVNKLDHH